MTNSAFFEQFDVLLSEKKLCEDSVRAFVSSEAAGAVVSFVGTVRNNTDKKQVLKLEFEAYAPMSIAEMQKILKNAAQKFGILRGGIHHRIGTVEVGEVAVVIAVSAPHRAAAFAACSFCIDTLKETVPIWKKEFFADGAVWVSAHP